MYLLDTNVISELRRPRPHGAVVAWLEGVGDHDLHLSAVTLGELQAGVEITREQDPERASQIESWIDQVAETWNVLPLDGRVFRVWAKLMHRRSDVENGSAGQTRRRPPHLGEKLHPHSSLLPSYP